MVVYIYENNKLNIIKKEDNIWFEGKMVAKILEYKNTTKAIFDHVDIEDKCKFMNINLGGNESVSHTYNKKNTIYINESGLYTLILRSNLAKAKEFKKWVTNDALPEIRKNGKYDLHKKVVNFIRNNYPKAILIPTLGENQIDDLMRIKSYNMGYQRGSFDIIIGNLHLKYNGFVIVFKTPQGYGKFFNDQNIMIEEYKKNNYKILISNNHDEIIKEIIYYFIDTRIQCNHCKRKFKSEDTLKNHLN